MTLQPVFSIFRLFSTALWNLPNFRSVDSLMLSPPPLPLSVLSSFAFHQALQDGFTQLGDLMWNCHLFNPVLAPPRNGVIAWTEKQAISFWHPTVIYFYIIQILL